MGGGGGLKGEQTIHQSMKFLMQRFDHFQTTEKNKKIAALKLINVKCMSELCTFSLKPPFKQLQDPQCSSSGAGNFELEWESQDSI